MQKQTNEEQDRSDQRCDPVLSAAPARVHLMEAFPEGEYDQGSDNEPAVVKPDLNSGDLSQFDVRTHTGTPSSYLLSDAIFVSGVTC